MRPRPLGALQRIALIWLRRRAERRLARETAALADAPRFQVNLPFSGAGPRGPAGGGQSFRAMVQINLMPRAR